MIMPAPFYPGSPHTPSKKKVMSRDKFINALTQLGKEKQLYEVLVSQNYSSESKANYLIDAVYITIQITPCGWNHCFDTIHRI